MDRVRNFAFVHQAIKDDAESCLLRDKSMELYKLETLTSRPKGQLCIWFFLHNFRTC